MGKRKKSKKNGVKYHGVVNIHTVAEVGEIGRWGAAGRAIKDGDYEYALSILSYNADPATSAAIKGGIKIKIIKNIFGKIPLIKGKRHGLSVVD